MALSSPATKTKATNHASSDTQQSHHGRQTQQKQLQPQLNKQSNDSPKQPAAVQRGQSNKATAAAKQSINQSNPPQPPSFKGNSARLILRNWEHTPFADSVDLALNDLPHLRLQMIHTGQDENIWLGGPKTAKINPPTHASTNREAHPYHDTPTCNLTNAADNVKSDEKLDLIQHQLTIIQQALSSSKEPTQQARLRHESSQIISATAPKQSEYTKNLDEEFNKAWDQPTRTPRANANKVAIFRQYCNLTQTKFDATALNVQNTLRYSTYLRHSRGINLSLKIFRGYLAPVVRHFKLKEHPLDKMGRIRTSQLELVLKKSYIIGPKTKIAFTRSLLRRVLQWLRNHPHTTAHTVAEALLLLSVTAARPANILMGSSETAAAQVLRVKHVVIPPGAGKAPDYHPIFIVVPNVKTSNTPQTKPVPFNTKSDNQCAATNLINRSKNRNHTDDAANAPVFINPTSFKPLSCSVANKWIKRAVKNTLITMGHDASLARFYSMYSARKSVASYMTQKGLPPQAIAKKLGHKTLAAQMSYLCSVFQLNDKTANFYAGLEK